VIETETDRPRQGERSVDDQTIARAAKQAARANLRLAKMIRKRAKAKGPDVAEEAVKAVDAIGAAGSIKDLSIPGV